MHALIEDLVGLLNQLSPNKLIFPIYISDQKFKDILDLLLLINDDQSHYVCIKDFNTFMFHKTKIKIKSGFVKVVCSVLVVKMC